MIGQFDARQDQGENVVVIVIRGSAYLTGVFLRYCYGL